MADEAKHTDVPDTGGFVQAIMMLDEGTVVSDCNDALAKLLKELGDYAYHYAKAKGTFTLKLNVSLDDNGTADIKAEVVTKAPKVMRPRTVAWVTKEGKLAKSNPKQLELGQIRVVPNTGIRREGK